MHGHQVNIHSLNPSAFDAGTSVDRVSDTLANTRLEEPMQESLTVTGFPQMSSESFIVLLHNDAAKNVRIHDVIDIIGILDPLLHDDVAQMDVQDEFDEFMEEGEVIDEAVDAENMSGNENSAVPTPTQPKVRSTYPRDSGFVFEQVHAVGLCLTCYIEVIYIVLT